MTNHANAVNLNNVASLKDLFKLLEDIGGGDTRPENLREVLKALKGPKAKELRTLFKKFKAEGQGKAVRRIATRTRQTAAKAEYVSRSWSRHPVEKAEAWLCKNPKTGAALAFGLGAGAAMAAASFMQGEDM